VDITGINDTIRKYLWIFLGVWNVVTTIEEEMVLAKG